MIGRDHGRAKRCNLPEGKKALFLINDEVVSCDDIQVRWATKETAHPLESPGQILLIAIEDTYDLSSRALNTVINGVIHTSIVFNEQACFRMASNPFLQFRSGPRILNDMLDVDIK